ncbi:NHL repeat-containing protein [Hymenobacter latericus]|uniref:hypothetical protein n=1 Tax=Hymenobacter sp. YIM 151858-1 TaxID=2987688 RepID=UPI0022273930|nr:hypothetical protein [Hymenobacter sp. YIM 151858-1]UYZ59060.1 hypothetical protein OIS50_18620 [Hymenobacter sp. YIM 151858-1]
MSILKADARRWALGALLLLGYGSQAQTATTPPSAPAAVRPPAQPAAKLPTAPAAGLALVRTIALPKPGPASLDRKGNLYVADAQNNLRQFAPDGQPLAVYSPPLPGHTASVEAWNTTKILVFYDDRQELQLLDRFMAPIATARLSELTDNGMVRAVTLAPDDNIWLLNESNLTLNQLGRGQQQRFTISTPLDLLLGRTKPDFRFLREYQNNLYLVDGTSGIWVFDNLGNYRKRLPYPGLSWVGFRGNELYYVQGGQVHFVDLYTAKERLLPLPVPEATQVLVGEQFLYTLSPAGVGVYRL